MEQHGLHMYFLYDVLFKALKFDYFIVLFYAYFIHFAVCALFGPFCCILRSPRAGPAALGCEKPKSPLSWDPGPRDKGLFDLKWISDP